MLAACAEPPAPATDAPPATVGYVEVTPRPLPLSLEYAAQLTGAREVEVRARVSGILLERLYDEGAAVDAGDVLFRLDPAPFRAEVARVRAELGVRRADLRQAERERDRILPLYEQDLASLQNRDAAIAAYEAAEAAVAAAEAALETAELQLSYTDVRAPIAGLTSREVRSEGSLVTAGADSSLLAYIVQVDRLYVDFSVPDAEAQLLRAALAASPDEVAVRVAGAPGAVADRKARVARIAYIAPRVDDATGTLAVRALVDNADGALLPGSIVRARIEGVSIEDALVIPKRAVTQGAEGPYVWRIDAAGTVAPQPVELGTASGNDVVVAAGLASGDRIVVDGILKVQAGAPVTAAPIASGTGAGARASQ